MYPYLKINPCLIITLVFIFDFKSNPIKVLILLYSIYKIEYNM